jgi:predicted ester cyclase
MTDIAGIVRQGLDCINAGDLDGYMSMYSPECQFVGYPEDVKPTFEGVKGFYGQLLSGIAALNVDPIDLFAAGQRVVVRYNITGDHMGELFGRPSTGHSIAVEGLTILYFQDDKVVFRINRTDEIALLTQIGVIATPSSTSG